jgi:site-specific recombinase XerD
LKDIADVLAGEVNKSRLSRAEVDLILLHFSELEAMKDLKKSTMRSRGHDLIRALDFLHKAGGTLDHCTTAQVLKAVKGMRSAGFSRNTQRLMISSFKKIIKWRIEEGANIDLKKVMKIKTPAMNYDSKKAEDLLTKEEFEQVMAACRNSRDRAIIALLYDGSHRPIEVVTLKWKDLLEDEQGFTVRTKEKTGKERFIRLTYSVPYLTMWQMDRGPYTPEDPVFITKARGDIRPITNATLVYLIKELKARTGITKLKPSIFRPSKITHDVEDGLDHSYLMMKNWGSLSTRMLAVYAKPSRDYIDRVALEHAGIKHEVKKGPKGKRLAPRQCPECGTLNPSGAMYCMICRAGLTEDATVKKGTILDVLRDIAKRDPEGLVEALKKL